ncbi:hypothetical protein [Streptomyces sp. NPDC058092]|uniref:hypothetical protein n=1 Tax=Streptomyces sp. NPDC058092 TaxID=3346336 RepID=UPI0036DFAE8B
MIANKGRRDITAGMFHNDEGFGFDFGVGVTMILGLTTTPSGTVLPVLRTGDSLQATRLEVRPSLLSRGQVITVTMLIDGDEKPVELLRAPLVDVKVVSEVPRASSYDSALEVMANQGPWAFAAPARAVLALTRRP